MNRINFSLLTLLTLFFIHFNLNAQLLHPNNLDFEEGEIGKMPRSWKIPEYAYNKQYLAYISENEPKSGRFCLELARYAEFKDSIYGSVMQSIDAKPYRGKTIKFGAWVRARITSPIGSAHLWLIEYLDKETIGFFDLMEDSPVVLNDWRYYEIIADIHSDAEFINFGLMLKGNGFAWIDAASFEVLDNSEKNYAPPLSLSNRQIHNLTVFAKLYGLAKYFCPTSESQELDFDKFALNGIRLIENIENDDLLIEKLNSMFNKYFPPIKIFDSKLPPNQYYYTNKPKEAIDNLAVSYVHIGAPTLNPSQLTESKMLNVYAPMRSSEGAVVQSIEVHNFIGSKAQFSIYAKSEIKQPFGIAQIRIMPEGESADEDFTPFLAMTTINDNHWKKYTIETEIPTNAKTLRIGLILVGEGNVWFDNANLEFSINGKTETVTPRNHDFEQENSDKLKFGWRLLPASKQALYTASIDNLQYKQGKQALRISSDKDTYIELPEPGEIILGFLSEDISFSLPFCLYMDENGTLPSAPQTNFTLDNTLEIIGNGMDRYSRLTVLIQAWNIFKHFNMFRNDPDYWDKHLPFLLRKAAADKNDSEFLKTLKLLVNLLDDSQARVWRGASASYHALPFLMKWDDENLIVTRVHNSISNLQPGDIITQINGKDTKTYLDEVSNFISAANTERAYLRAIAELRVGFENTPVHFEILDRNGTKSNVTFRRNIYINELVEDRLPPAAEIKDGIFYVDLTAIDDKAFFDLLGQLQKSKSIIFDLRGTTMISEHVISFFIKEPIKSVSWYIPYFTKPIYAPLNYKILRTSIKPRGTLANKPIVFLQDERTVGFSEVIITMFKENNLGEIVGRKSAGTGGESSSFSLGGHYGFSWTTIKAVDSSQKDIYGSGIEPTVEITKSNQEYDEVIKIALELIKQN